MIRMWLSLEAIILSTISAHLPGGYDTSCFGKYFVNHKVLYRSNTMLCFMVEIAMNCESRDLNSRPGSVTILLHDFGQIT